MASVTLSTLRTRVRQRADMEGSQFVTDAEVTTHINSAVAELHDVLVSKYGEDYFADEATASTVAGTEDVSLPADTLKVLGVDVLDGAVWRSLHRYGFAERNRWPSDSRSIPGHYRVQADAIRLRPVPDAAYSLKVHYVPQATALANDADTYQGRGGWEEYVVVDAAIRCLVKEESDTSALQLAKAQLLARIEAAASSRDVGQPAQVVDVCEADW